MANALLSLLGAVLVVMVPTSARAICTDKDLGPGWLWNYDGTIGDRYRVRVTLTVAHGEVAGVYFYSTQLRDIRIVGRIFDGTRIALDELNASGRVTARFEGEFPERDPRGTFEGTLRCDVIVGSWRKIDAAQGLPVYLYRENGTSGTLAHRYAVAGAQDDSLIHRNAYRFWDAVIKRDKPTVASLIHYPINVHVAGAVRSIRTRRELITQYDAIFSSAYREAIAAALPRNMFVRDQGIMLGQRGEVWFGANGRVIALNNRGTGVPPNGR